MQIHHHQCPYCKAIWSCNEECYSSRVNNKTCVACLAIDEKELVAIVKEHGSGWQTDIIW
jgi:hypothetical protein